MFIILFIQGSLYWRYTNYKLDPNYPKDLSEGFAGVPANIDTAFVWSGNGKIFFFKGGHCRDVDLICQSWGCSS